jgi:hypothetical protein
VQSNTLFDRISDYLTELDWTFTAHADKGYVTLILRLRDGSVRVMVDAVEGAGWSRVLVHTTYSIYVPEHKRQAVSEAIARINYKLVFGNLEMDLSDGEVRVRTSLESDAFIGEPMIDRAVRKCTDIANQYQAALLAIAFGNAAPKDVLELASQSDGATLQ